MSAHKDVRSALKRALHHAKLGMCASAISTVGSATNIYSHLGFRDARLEKAVRRVGRIVGLRCTPKKV